MIVCSSVGSKVNTCADTPDIIDIVTKRLISYKQTRQYRYDITAKQALFQKNSLNFVGHDHCLFLTLNEMSRCEARCSMS